MIIPTSPPIRDFSGNIESKLLRQIWPRVAGPGATGMLQNPMAGFASAAAASVGSVKNLFSGLTGPSMPDVPQLDTGAIGSFNSQFDSFTTLSNDYSSVCGQMFAGTGSMELPASFGSGFSVPPVQETLGLVQHQQSLQNRLRDPDTDPPVNDCAPVSSMLGSLINDGKAVFASVSGAIADVYHGIAGAAGELIDGVKSALSGAATAIQEAIAAGGAGLEAAIAAGQAAFNEAFAGIHDAVAPVFSAIGEAASSLASTIAETVSSVTSAIKDTISDAIVGIMASIREGNPCLTAVLDGDADNPGVLPSEVKAYYDDYAAAKAEDRGTP